MKKIFTLLILLCFSTAGVLAQHDRVTVSFAPEKKVEKKEVKDVPIPPAPAGVLQGGENIATATVIPSLPYTDIGSTDTYLDNYNEVCPGYTDVGGKDVVYSYTPSVNGVIDISLCGDATDFDTKLYVYDTPTPVTGDAIACNEDYCSTLNFPYPWVSQLSGVPVTGGTTYYIVVDAFSSYDYGTYELSVVDGILYPVPPNDECTGATQVNGPFPQTVNGTTLGATVDCPGLLDWNAVWYAVSLPYAINDLTVDWCGTENMGTVGVVYYATCPVSCSDYIIYTSNVWQTCGTPPGATTALTSFLAIPGPTTIYYPAYSLPQMDHVITFNVTEVTCPDPTGLLADNITTTTANLTWTPGGTETDWEYAYGPAPFPVPVTPGTPTTSNTLNPISGLSSGTAYQFYVRAVCGTDYSDWVGPADFVTLCDAISIFPWNESFEMVTMPALPPCWLLESGGWVTTDNSSSTYDADARTGERFLREPWSATNEYVWTPGFALTAGISYDFSFWWAGDGYADWQGDVFYNTSQSSVGATQLGPSFVVPTTTTTKTYAQVISPLVPAVSGTYYFAIRVNEATGAPWYLSFDDFRMEPTPDCIAPTALLATDLALTSANLTWTPGGPETDWEYVYGEAPLPIPAGPGIATSSNTVNPISGLTPNTSYQFYARSVCGPDQFSSWSGPSSFFTGYCIPAPINVDGLGITNVTFSTVNNTTGAEPGNYGDYSALVGDVQQTTTVPVYITYQTGFTYDTKIWIDWNDDLDFDDPGEEVYSGTSLADNPTTLAASFDVAVSAPLGNHRMRIGGVDTGPPTPCYTGYYGSFEDYTINVIEPPTCLPPANMTTLNITSGSAELSFDVPPILPDSFFDVFYALDGIAPGGTEGTTLTGVMPSVTIENLEENTAYNWYARSVCGLDQPDIEHFWMAIDQVNQLVPGLNGGSTEVMDTGEDMTWYQYQDESGDFWYNIWFYNDPYDDTRMKIIKMGFWVQRLDPAVEGNIYYVVNWSAPGWLPDPPAFPMPEDEVYVERSPTNGPFPVIAADITNPYGHWIELTYTIPDYNPAWVSVDIWGDNIIILNDLIEPPIESPLNSWWQQSPGPGGILVHECVPKPSGNSSDWGGPMVFTTLPQCPAPAGLAAGNITTSSAELSWIGPPDSFFDVFFGPGSDPFDGIIYTTVTSPLLLEDLEPGNDYSFSVRTDCGFDAPKVDYFWMAMDDPGILLPSPASGGTFNEPGEDGIWYLYNNAPGEMDWWNIWFYNDPVDNSRMKKMRMGFWISSLDGVTPGMLNYVFNWSDPTWPGPGFPTPMNETFIHRSPVNGPMPIPPGVPIWVELYYIIPDYNPEWVSVDIWGENIQILQVAPQAPPAGSPLAQYWVPGSPAGIIVHECLPKNSGPSSTWSVPVTFTTLCPANFNLPFCESFDPPVSTVSGCWTEQLEGTIITPHWGVLATNAAGGLVNELYASFSPAEGATQADNDRLVTPPLNTAGMTSINLSFKQYLDDYYAGVNDVWVKVQSSSDGLTWTDEWVYPAGLGVDILPENKHMVITNNVGSTTYLAWTLSGYTYDINSWHVDDICIYGSCLVNTWTGAISTQWNDPDNWSCGILPNNQTTVAIPAGLPRYPIVPAGITAYCYDVDLETGATLMVATGAVLNVVNP